MQSLYTPPQVTHHHIQIFIWAGPWQVIKVMDYGFKCHPLRFPRERNLFHTKFIFPKPCFVWSTFSLFQRVCICHPPVAQVMIRLHDNHIQCLKLSLPNVWHIIHYSIFLSSERNFSSDNRLWLHAPWKTDIILSSYW